MITFVDEETDPEEYRFHNAYLTFINTILFGQ